MAHNIELSVAVAMILIACSDSPSSNQAATSDTNAATAPMLSPSPPHIWQHKEGQEYGYAAALSDDDKRAGKAASEVHMFRYLGQSSGVYVIGDDTGMVRASCANPCQVIKIESFGQIERMTFNLDSILGEAFTDAFNGQLEVYDSMPADQTPPPRSRASGSPASADRPAGNCRAGADNRSLCRRSCGGARCGGPDGPAEQSPSMSVRG